MKTISTILTTLMLLLGLQLSAGVDDSIERVDRLQLAKFNDAMDRIEKRDQLFEQKRQELFDRYVADVLGGKVQEPATYTAPLSRLVEPILSSWGMDLSKEAVARLNATMTRQGRDYDREAKAAMSRRQEVGDRIVLPLVQALGAQVGHPDEISSEEIARLTENPALSITVFQVEAAKLANLIEHDGDMMSWIHNDQDRLEDFLTPEAREMYAKVTNGKRATYLLTANYKKAMERIMKNYLLKEKYFNAERHLETAVQKYRRDDRHGSLRSMLAFVKLINRSNPDATDEGYRLLQEVHESIGSEQTAYNLVRVGIRLGHVDDAMLWKLIDHVEFAGDTMRLSRLNELAMIYALSNGQAERAYTRLTELEKMGAVDQLPDQLKAIILLRTGRFDQLNNYVASTSIRDLLNETHHPVALTD